MVVVVVGQMHGDISTRQYVNLDIIRIIIIIYTIVKLLQYSIKPNKFKFLKI